MWRIRAAGSDFPDAEIGIPYRWQDRPAHVYRYSGGINCEPTARLVDHCVKSVQLPIAQWVTVSVRHPNVPTTVCPGDISIDDLGDISIGLHTSATEYISC